MLGSLLPGVNKRQKSRMTHILLQIHSSSPYSLPMLWQIYRVQGLTVEKAIVTLNIEPGQAYVALSLVHKKDGPILWDYSSNVIMLSPYYY